MQKLNHSCLENDNKDINRDKIKKGPVGPLKQPNLTNHNHFMKMYYNYTLNKSVMKMFKKIKNQSSGASGITLEIASFLSSGCSIKTS
jgi:hypothetical protein